MRDAKQRHLPEPQTDSYRSYSYDLIGQRVEKCVDGECHNYQWGLDSGWLELVELPTEEDLAFSWSAGGNLLGISQTGQSVLEFQYDERGRASSIMFGVSGRADAFRYDTSGRRVFFASDTDGDGIADKTRRYFDDGRVFLEMENDGTVLRAFVFAPGEIAPVLVVEPEAQHYFFHYDHLKRPRLVTDDSGTVVWRAWYEPFGLVHEETDPDGDGMAFEQPFRLPGQFEHDNSQVYYNRYRWYLPAHGIYNRLDPESLLKAQLGIPDDPILSELRWTYGRSAPLTESDPLGLASGGKLPSLLDAWEAYRKAWCSCMQGKEKTRDNKSFCCGNAKSACHKKCNTKYKMPWCLGAKAACNIHCNELQSTCKIYAQGNANTNWFGCAGEGE